MRLIDADALMDEIAVLLERNEKLIDGWLANIIDDTIEQAPTIDAVEVVRCKHCRKWTNGDDTYGTCQWNEYQTLQTRYDDFCSYGERRTDE
jgi:hypothetical protein